MVRIRRRLDIQWRPALIQLGSTPEIGCELKTARCGSYGIMLIVILTKPAAENHKQPYEDVNPRGAATVLRLLDPCFNPVRRVRADSFFRIRNNNYEDLGCRYVIHGSREDCYPNVYRAIFVKYQDAMEGTPRFSQVWIILKSPIL